MTKDITVKTERLQKILSQAGVASRRTVEQWIQAGWVTVNHKPAALGQKVSANDLLTVKGKAIANPLKLTIKTRVLLYHKPEGEICSRNDPDHPNTVFDRLPYLRHERWVPVGRLDINTSGLLIFTTNGELANRLMHPKFQIEREYAVRVRGQVTKEQLDNLRKGVVLEKTEHDSSEKPAKFNKVSYQGGEGVNAWYHVTLTEGRNREVKRLWQSQGLEVSRLIRIRYGHLTLPRHLSRGESQELTEEEVAYFLAKLEANHSPV